LKKPNLRTASALKIWRWFFLMMIGFLFGSVAIACIDYINIRTPQRGNIIQTKVVFADYCLRRRGGSSRPCLEVEDWRKPDHKVSILINQAELALALNDNRCMTAEVGRGRLGLWWIVGQHFGPCDSKRAGAVTNADKRLEAELRGLPEAQAKKPTFLSQVEKPDTLIQYASKTTPVSITARCRLRINQQGRVVEGYCQSPPYPGWARAVLDHSRATLFKPPHISPGQNSSFVQLTAVFEILPYPLPK
jgi:hypothetical protein